MDGTLSPDGSFVLHMSEWIPAVLSPDYSWYAHEGEWHPLSPPSIKLARIQKNKSLNSRYENPAESNQTSSGKVALFLLGIIVSLWFILDSSGRGLTHPGILEISWLEMAGANCSVLDEPVFRDLAHDCYQAARQAQVFLFSFSIFILVFFVLPLLAELGKGSGTVNTPASASSRGPPVCEHGQERSRCMSCSPNGALRRLLRARVRGALKGYRKACSTPELLGCSIEVCRKHLEDQFEAGMNWENHDNNRSYREWYIDYRRPCASFDLEFEEQQRMCFHYTNLQPMWGPQSSSKRSSFDEDSFEWEWTGEEWEFTGSD